MINIIPNALTCCWRCYYINEKHYRFWVTWFYIQIHRYIFVITCCTETQVELKTPTARKAFNLLFIYSSCLKLDTFVSFVNVVFCTTDDRFCLFDYPGVVCVSVRSFCNLFELSHLPMENWLKCSQQNAMYSGESKSTWKLY